MAVSPSAVGPTVAQRVRGARGVVVALVVIVALAFLTVWLTAPRPGGRMDPGSTSPEGAHALVTLIRDRGVEVVEAPDIAAVEAAARPDTLIVVVQTPHLFDEDVLRRLAALPGDRLVVEPISRIREALAPRVRPGDGDMFGNADPGCTLREATRSGSVSFGSTDAYQGTGNFPVTRCYDGALVRYTDDGRTVTVVGSADFMANSSLLDAGNAALAMNLAGAQPRMIWYAPQTSEGDLGGSATFSDLVPVQVKWIVFQLAFAVALFALWKGRRIGPLVAERLPVVVRASETVEGRGRMYRSGRARDRAAEALRTATLQRITPRLGLGPDTAPPAVVQAVAEHCARNPHEVGMALFGPVPVGDEDLVNLASQLDDIERQVARA